MARPSQKCARFLSENAALFPSPRKIHSFFARSFICVRNVCQSVRSSTIAKDGSRKIHEKGHKDPSKSWSWRHKTFESKSRGVPLLSRTVKSWHNPERKAFGRLKKVVLNFTLLELLNKERRKCADRANVMYDQAYTLYVSYLFEKRKDGIFRSVLTKRREL